MPLSKGAVTGLKKAFRYFRAGLGSTAEEARERALADVGSRRIKEYADYEPSGVYYALRKRHLPSLVGGPAEWGGTEKQASTGKGLIKTLRHIEENNPDVERGFVKLATARALPEAKIGDFRRDRKQWDEVVRGFDKKVAAEGLKKGHSQDFAKYLREEHGFDAVIFPDEYIMPSQTDLPQLVILAPGKFKARLGKTTKVLGAAPVGLEEAFKEKE